MSSYVYEFELLFKMKVYLMFYINLLWFLKNDLISRQMSLSQFMIIKMKKTCILSIWSMTWNKIWNLHNLSSWLNEKNTNKKHENHTW